MHWQVQSVCNLLFCGYLKLFDCLFETNLESYNSLLIFWKYCTAWNLQPPCLEMSYGAEPYLTSKVFSLIETIVLSHHITFMTKEGVHKCILGMIIAYLQPWDYAIPLSMCWCHHLHTAPISISFVRELPYLFRPRQVLQIGLLTDKLLFPVVSIFLTGFLTSIGRHGEIKKKMLFYSIPTLYWNIIMHYYILIGGVDDTKRSIMLQQSVFILIEISKTWQIIHKMVVLPRSNRPPDGHRWIFVSSSIKRHLWKCSFV